MTDTDLLEIGEGTASIFALPLVLANTHTFLPHLDQGYPHPQTNKRHLLRFCARIMKSSGVVYDTKIIILVFRQSFHSTL